MKQYVYCYYNKIAGFYTAPIVSPYDNKQIVELTHQSFLSNVGTQDHELQLNHDLYFLGLFETKNGSFKLEEKPLFLTSFAAGEVDVGSENN